MYQQIELSLLRRFDPLALTSLARDRALYYACKRLIDVVTAAILLVLAAPLMLLIALLIFLDSGWPVIFAQERVGALHWNHSGYAYWQRTLFTCYKFRTMIRNADPSLHQAFVKAFVHGNVEPCDKTHSQFKLTNDPRVTCFGRLLRKSSLDELPQLINVLKGEMSMVGPRPVPQYEVAEYKSWHFERLAAIPGLTGLWQINGRCQVSFDEMAKMDIEYARHPSLWLDIKIMFLTVPAVLSGRGAE